jgi:hypothetical protein
MSFALLQKPASGDSTSTLTYLSTLKECIALFTWSLDSSLSSLEPRRGITAALLIG